MYGTVILEGNGTGTNGPYTTTTNESASMQFTMAAQAGCSWVTATKVGMGSGSDQIFMKDQLIDTTCPAPQTDIWSGSAPGDNLQVTFGISPFVNLYSVQAFDAEPGTFSQSGCINGSTSLDIALGPNKLASVSNVPLPDTLQISGVRSFTDLATSTAQTNVPANWNFAYSLSANPDDMCEDCTKHMIHDFASDLSIGNQSLGEDVDIVGTPLVLHYESSRAPGRAGVDAAAMWDAHSLGGWTLNVHHVLQPLLQSFCFGGTCTPYAIVPKAIFLGDGQSRTDDSIQGPLSLNGNLLVAAEDGSEVYVFSNHGLHLQTLLPLTGAVMYTFAYDPFNRLVSITDNSGNVTTIQRDVNGNPTAIVAPFGQKTVLAVDGNGFLSQITDPAGLVTKFSNSVSGLLKSLTDPLGKTFMFQYDSFGGLTAHTDPNGATVSLARTNNSSGYSVVETSPMGRTTSRQVAFSSSSTQNNRNFTNTWENGLQATSSRSLQSGQITEGSVLPDGTSFSSTQAADPRWGMQAPFQSSYTAKDGTLTSAFTSTSSVTLNNPADPFSLATATDTQSINGRFFTSAFTGSTRSFINTTPAGRKTTVKLDTKERVVSTQVTGLTATTYAYDSRGRIVSTSQGTRKTSFSYNPKGFLATVTDPMLLKTSFAYDADGRRTTTTLPDGRIIRNAYDGDGNLTSVTLPSGAVHQLAYASLDLPSTYTPPAATGSGPTQYAYDLDHALTTVTRPDAQTIAYAYDSAGRMASVTTSTGTTSLVYNATTGTLTSAKRGTENLAYTYNGSLLTKSSWTGPVTGNVSQIFDINLRVTSQTVNGANAAAYQYDKDGLTTKAGLLAITRNAQNGLVTGTSLGVATDSRTYNSFGELSGYTASVSGSPAYQVTFTRDADGRINARSETVAGVNNSYSYSYDTGARLVSVGKNASTDSYGYDSNSNRVTATTTSGTVTAAYDAQDRLVNYGSTAFTYTANGELASQIAGSATTTYTYDVLGNLIAATLPNGTKVGYVVDAENHRVGRSLNNVQQTGFLYDDSDRVVAQLDGSNVLVTRFVYATNEQTPDYMIKGGVTYRIFSDHLGSPVLVVNTSTGATAEQITYDEFGNVLADTSPGFQPFGFAGGLYDLDTKLLQFGARDYNPAVGRWTAKDPTLFAGGDMNLYGYVVADPVNLTDPTGLGCDKKKVKKIINKLEHKITGDKIPIGPVNVSIVKPEMSVGASKGIKVNGKTVVEVKATATVGVTATPPPAKSTGDVQFYQDPHPIIQTEVSGKVSIFQKWGKEFANWKSKHWDTSKWGVVPSVRGRFDGYEDRCDGICRDR